MADLLIEPALTIPHYQRPYKWGTTHVTQLLSDISNHRKHSAYRMGTIVFHEDDGKNNIVDGQQRTLTLMMVVRALLRFRRSGIQRTDLKVQLDSLESEMVDPPIDSTISKRNMRLNFLEISRIISRFDFDEATIEFFLNSCEVVTFTLGSLSEAFQFFDSQNSRGRDLDPHDLLKAYHLREFTTSDESIKALTVADWENCESRELAILFSEYLFRIRNWSKRQPARSFGKNEAGLFKGVNLDADRQYPYVQQLRIAHHFVDQYKGQYERRIDGVTMPFPFCMDQTIVNGKRFFEMISHYQSRVQRAVNGSMRLRMLIAEECPVEKRSEEGILAIRILDTINSYEGHRRTGDRYVRVIFDCLQLYYVDKFEGDEICRAVEKIFIFAFTLRLKMQLVSLATMDNYVIENNLFSTLRDATSPAEFFNASFPGLQEIKSTKTVEIEELFREMKYLE